MMFRADLGYAAVKRGDIQPFEAILLATHPGPELLRLSLEATKEPSVSERVPA
jgi:hypothetical protein